MEEGPSRERAGRHVAAIGYVAGIWKALAILYSQPDLADNWVNRPNAHFADMTPLQRMVAGEVSDLAAVRAYVDDALRLGS